MTTTARIGAELRDVSDRVDTVPRSRRVWRVFVRPQLVVGICAAIAATWALVGSRVVFPLLTNDHDEAVYLLQANAIEHGHLWGGGGADPAAFVPWLTAQHGHHFVPKYAPAFPTMLAIGRWVFGTERAALALIAAGVILVTYLVATEILERRDHAALASVFLLLTPLFIVQSATFLPYLASLLLLEGFAFGLLRGWRTARRPWLVLAGMCFGLAFFARPYDALLFTLPLAGFVGFRSRHDLPTFARHTGWIVVGLVPPALATAAFNHAATGSAFRMPFSIIDSRDTLGFGTRAMDPNNPAVRFTPGLGWTGLSRHLTLTMFWCFGGMVLIGCALFYIHRRKWRGSAAALGAVALAIPLGYLFFWGTYGAAAWGAPWYLGPYYYTPTFAGIAILGAGGYVMFFRDYRRIAAAALACMVLLSAFVVGQAMVKNWRLSQDDRRLNAALIGHHPHHALVFLPALYGPHLLHPFASAANTWDTTGDLIYAIDRGDAANAAVAADYASRTPYLLTISGQYRATPPDPTLTSTLEPLHLLEGHIIVFTVAFHHLTTDPFLAVTLDINGRRDRYVVDDHARRGSAEHLTVTVTPTTTTTVAGRVLSHTRRTVPTNANIQIDISTAPNARAASQIAYFRQLGFAQRGNALVVVVPGQELNPYRTEPISISTH